MPGYVLRARLSLVRPMGRAVGVARGAPAREWHVLRGHPDRTRLQFGVVLDLMSDGVPRFRRPRLREQPAFRHAVSRQLATVWKSTRSSRVVGRLASSMVGSKRRATSAMTSSVTRLRISIHAIVVRLPAGAVRLDEPDAVKDERKVALDVCVDTEEQIAVRGNGTISRCVERDSPRRRDRGSPSRPRRRGRRSSS